MSKFTDLRRKSNAFTTPSSKDNLEESSLIYTQLNALNSKIDDIVASDNIDDATVEKLSIAIDCINSVYDELDPEASKKSEIEAANESVIIAVIEALRENVEIEYILNDGETVIITPKIAKYVANIHDELNEHNQLKLKLLMNESLDSFNFAINFCESNYTG
jgi:hypothetical protein